LNYQPKIVIDNVLYVPKLIKSPLATKSFREEELKIVIGKRLVVQDKTGGTNHHGKTA
jgi:hypothetical protein